MLGSRHWVHIYSNNGLYLDQIVVMSYIALGNYCFIDVVNDVNEIFSLPNENRDSVVD
jgi:hypothetical protein